MNLKPNEWEFSSRAQLAKDVFDHVVAATEQFRKVDLGAVLALLMGAILGGEGYAAQAGDIDDAELFLILAKRFPNTAYPVWTFFQLRDEDKALLPASIVACILGGRHGAAFGTEGLCLACDGGRGMEWPDPADGNHYPGVPK